MHNSCQPVKYKLLNVVGKNIIKIWKLFLKTDKTEHLILFLYNVIVTVVKCGSNNVLCSRIAN